MKSKILSPGMARLLLPLITLVFLFMTLSAMGRSRAASDLDQEARMDEDERMASWNKDEVPELIEEEEELPKKQQVLNKDIKDLEKESVESIAEKHVPSQTEVLPSSSSLVPFSTHAPLISAAPSGVASNNSTLVSNTTIETDRKTTVLEEPSKNISTIALNQTSVTEDKKPAPLNTTQPVPIKIPIAGDDEEESLDFAALVSRYILKRNQSPPPRFRQWFDYAKKNKCYLDRYASIYRDLAPFMDMSRADFKQRLELLKTAPRVHVIQIKDGKRVSRINHVVIASLVQFLPDMDIIINGLDEPRILFDPSKEPQVPPLPVNATASSFWNTPARGHHSEYLLKHCRVYSPSRPFVLLNPKHGFFIEPDSRSYSHHLLPMLSQTRMDPCFSDILVPSAYYVGAATKGAAGRDQKWETRQPTVFWRGKTTGGHAIGGNYKEFHRQRLMDLHKKNASLFDVAFIDVTQCDKEDCEKMSKEYPFAASRSPFEENFKHKYLIDIDGNTFSGRFFALLFSGSLVFKPTAFTEYFRDWLKPYVHYIPVEMDLSDLESKVQWALEHDAEAKQIAMNGQKFAESHLQESQMHCYTYLLLLEMARLMGVKE